MQVQAPNGDIYDLPDAVASGLAGTEGWSLPTSKAEKPEAQARATRTTKK